MNCRALLRRLALAICVAAVSSAAVAAPDEIQVYTEELNDPGEFGVELHVNYVPSGAKTPSYPGEMPSHHMLQVTPEFSYGLAKTLEAGLYVPVAIAPNGNLYQNGARLRLKYIAPRGEDDAFFWGLNTEIGYFARRVSESYWALELRPIIGYRSRDWLFSLNPILDVDVKGQVIHCYPLSGLGSLSLTPEADAAGLRSAFEARSRSYRQAGVFQECSACSSKTCGECPGGCLAAAIRRFRHTPFSLIAPRREVAS